MIISQVTSPPELTIAAFTNRSVGYCKSCVEKTRSPPPAGPGPCLTARICRPSPPPLSFFSAWRKSSSFRWHLLLLLLTPSGSVADLPFKTSQCVFSLLFYRCVCKVFRGVCRSFYFFSHADLEETWAVSPGTRPKSSSPQEPRSPYDLVLSTTSAPGGPLRRFLVLPHCPTRRVVPPPFAPFFLPVDYWRLVVSRLLPFVASGFLLPCQSLLLRLGCFCE